MKRNNIILIGYMGCGKTTVGKCLANISGYTFTDTDELIVQQQERTVSEIFAAEGEPRFRDMETELLRNMLKEKNDGLVISTGGGMPVREENRALLSELGYVVYLKASAETIYERVRYDTTRPLLQCDDPLERIKQMLEQRESAYEAATQISLSVDDLRPEEAAKIIMNSVKKEG